MTTLVPMATLTPMEAHAARRLATELLRGLPRRLSHVIAVGETAESITASVGDPTGEQLVVAAFLHDIGYAPLVVDTGFHPLDGARYLRSRGIDEVVCQLVAYHSAAIVEAHLRGLSQPLTSEFADIDGDVSDALWYCDMVTAPDGQRCTIDERLDEIRERYGPNDVVTKFTYQAEPELRAAVTRVQKRLAKADMSQPI